MLIGVARGEEAPDIGKLPAGSAVTEQAWANARPRGDFAEPPPEFVVFDRASELRYLGQGRPTRVYRSLFLGRLWISGEYLAWSMKDQTAPPLLTTGPAIATDDAGTIGRPGTEVLFGNRLDHDNLRSGGRITLGYWCAPFQTTGIEGTYFGVEGPESTVVVDSGAYPVLARPFVSLPGLDESSWLIAYPGLWDGNAVARANTELSGAECLLRHALHWDGHYRMDGLVGYRYGFLDDTVQIGSASVSLDATTGLPPGALVEREDLFHVRNELHGCELGLAGRWWLGCWSLQAHSKLTLGTTRARTEIEGATAVTETVGGTQVVSTFDGGLLAQPSNRGIFSDTELGALSDFSLAVEYQVGRDLRAAVGYSVLFWNSVSRAAAQIDGVVDPATIPPSAMPAADRPQYSLQRNDFWAQGLNFRLEYQF